jgi:maleate cis-trans isomerase
MRSPLQDRKEAAMSWQRKLGVIVPSWNTVMEYEWQRLAGDALSVHSQRIRHLADTEADLLWLSTQAGAAAELLAHAKVDAICHGCTASGFLKSPEDDLAQEAALTRSSGIPTGTSSAAIVRALRAVGATRISVASPYEAWLNDRVQQHLEAAGFTVVAMKGLGTQAHGSISTDTVRALALEVVRPDTEAVFISCSNFRTLDILAQVEQATGLPVITSNQAALWGTLRAIDDRRIVPGAGRLFAEA